MMLHSHQIRSSCACGSSSYSRQSMHENLQLPMHSLSHNHSSSDSIRIPSTGPILLRVSETASNVSLRKNSLVFELDGGGSTGGGLGTPQVPEKDAQNTRTRQHWSDTTNLEIRKQGPPRHHNANFVNGLCNKLQNTPDTDTHTQTPSF